MQSSWATSDTRITGTAVAGDFACQDLLYHNRSRICMYKSWKPTRSKHAEERSLCCNPTMRVRHRAKRFLSAHDDQATRGAKRFLAAEDDQGTSAVCIAVTTPMNYIGTHGHGQPWMTW
mmetsp:Transcript_53170/g.139510  ORF Transcript_53170/g.139510 Transcript_53170/m.139510 type:complete len:119 (-) Transcript_53170:43-399(-)